ncbi:Uncharacterised protein [Dermatophilus congolensis]|uniref:Uncharacterized protein n=1 Tax=Dermatophilus congolensis TaxID=1863 RepID=A0AA46BN94_9MICO|nr:Uncharacterised protein [Dermatophilus congolensis]
MASIDPVAIGVSDRMLWRTPRTREHLIEAVIGLTGTTVYEMDPHLR